MPKVKIKNYYWSEIDKADIGKEIQTECQIVKENKSTVVVKVPELNGRELTVKKHKILYD